MANFQSTKVLKKSIVRLYNNGLLDDTFNASILFEGNISSIIIQHDGKFIIGGNVYYNNNPLNSKNIERLNNDGTPDATYKIGQGFDDTLYYRALQVDGRIIAVSGFTKLNGITRSRITRLNN